MNSILVLAEHRRRQIRDVTFEMLAKAKTISEELDIELTAVLLGREVKDQAQKLSEHANRVLVVENEQLENFNSEAYKTALTEVMNKYKPILTMIGHTSFGVELAPRLAASLKLPLATDCIDLSFTEGKLQVTRQMYGGKVNVEAEVREADGYIVTVRQAAFSTAEPSYKGEIVDEAVSIAQVTDKRFVEYVLPPPGGIDITAADVLVGIGRGIKDQDNMQAVEQLAESLNGALACSRPIVDKGWLPSNRQVGTSGKTVKPKLYIALGISGAFQHVLGMKNSELIIAINKDQNAPIFSFSDYGVVEDMFKILPQLKGKIDEMKKRP